MSTFSSARRQLARERCGLLGKELAARCDVTVRSSPIGKFALTVSSRTCLRGSGRADFLTDFFFCRISTVYRRCGEVPGANEGACSAKRAV